MTGPPEERVPLGRAGRRARPPLATSGPGHDPGQGPGRGRRGGTRRLAALAGVALLLLGGIAVYAAWALGPAGTSTVPVEFEVVPGSGARAVADDLHQRGLIRQPQLFVALLMWRGSDRRIGEGIYDLAPAMSATDIADLLERGGRPRTTRVVIPEGSRIQDVAVRLEAAGIGSRDAALTLALEPGAPVGRVVPAGTGLEGYLFPATYELPVGEEPRRALARMVERFERELDEATARRLEQAGLDVHEWVTLASMVQAEAAGDHEMPIIAGVFLNRLEIGMPLQSDPTVAYGLGKDLPALDFPGGDFDVDHPWNTYTRGGLPAGPIGSPGRAALEAVLAPERTRPDGRPWLYFLHGSADGAPVFRPNVDFEGHLRDVARYLRR